MIMALHVLLARKSTAARLLHPLWIPACLILSLLLTASSVRLPWARPLTSPSVRLAELETFCGQYCHSGTLLQSGPSSMFWPKDLDTIHNVMVVHITFGEYIIC